MIHRCLRAVWLISLLSMIGCGGGGGGGSAGDSLGPNELAVIVDAGPTANAINMPFVTVTVCAPGGASCQSVDHVLVDTGSTGLRLMASVVRASVFPQQTDGQNPVVECTTFADGYAWGPVKLADVRLSGKEARSIPIQIIGDPGSPAVPADCSQRGTALDSVGTFGSKGVLGVKAFEQDCGDSCTLDPSNGAYTPFYYACPTGSPCTSVSQPLDRQVQNPVSHFDSDNNGIILELPAIPARGTANVRGKLVFGIQANNITGSPHILPLDPASGSITMTFNNETMGGTQCGVGPCAFIDSGSNALFFFDPTISACRRNSFAFGFYCPSTRRSETASLLQSDATPVAIDFEVDNAEGLMFANPTFTAFGTLAGPSFSGIGFIWGLPFFFGRDVIVAIDGKPTPIGNGPFIAF
jgi:hypothetical protein